MVRTDSDLRLSRASRPYPNVAHPHGEVERSRSVLVTTLRKQPGSFVRFFFRGSWPSAVIKRHRRTYQVASADNCSLRTVATGKYLKDLGRIS
jgi:hypothetical protein